MTKRNNHLGYINERCGTDVDSYEIFEENGKTYAVKVEKVKATDPRYTAIDGCYCCINNEEIFDTDKTTEVGVPFEITKNKSGAWGYKSKDIIANLFGIATMEKAEACVKKPLMEGVAYSITKDADGYNLCIYSLTKGGKPRNVFNKLGNGKIVETCGYYYDYNF